MELPLAKYEDAFPCSLVVSSSFVLRRPLPISQNGANPGLLRRERTFGPNVTAPLCYRAVSIGSWSHDRRIRPQMCFGWSPAHRCARCTLSRSSVVISAWRCEALIQRNSGDNHAQRALVHLEGPLRGPPGPSGPRSGSARRPGGGQKLSPPGDGGHLTDFVAN